MANSETWNLKYAARELVWGVEPNRFVAAELADREPAGQALDLACGEGRNALWLAARGWSTTGVDFSSVALDRARRLAAERGVKVLWVEADVTAWEPEPGSFALVVVAYLQLPAADLARALGVAARALAPGGELFGIAHALRNCEEGTGGPPDPAVTWDPAWLAETLRALGLEVQASEEVLRPVDGADRDAIDTLVRAKRTWLS